KAPGVFFTCPATPSLPLPPSPTGHLTDVPRPTFSSHSLLTLQRKSTQMYVVPLPSERCTITMGVFGRLTPGLADLMRSSSQLVILPRKISASSSPVKCSLGFPGRL